MNAKISRDSTVIGKIRNSNGSDCGDPSLQNGSRKAAYLTGHKKKKHASRGGGGGGGGKADQMGQSKVERKII